METDGTRQEMDIFWVPVPIFHVQFGGKGKFYEKNTIFVSAMNNGKILLDVVHLVLGHSLRCERCYMGG